MRQQRERGFTLIELSMVLVLIGVILGMVFKGKGLIDQAKTKSVQAQMYKIQAANESFRQQYGHWPGEGCLSHEATQCNGEKNGWLDKKAEQHAFWSVLIHHQFLSEQDRIHAFGKPWALMWAESKSPLARHYLTTTLPLAQACLLDRQFDDGVSDTGMFQVIDQQYNNKKACQSLQQEATTILYLS